MNKSTEQYEKATSEISQILIKTGCVNLSDFDIIHAWLMRYPYALGDGRFCYDRKFYENADDLPEEAKLDLKQRGCL